MYNTILSVITVIGQGLRKSQRKTLAAVVEGMLLRTSCNLAEIARGIGRHCQFSSRLKQVWRYVHNQQIDPKEVSQGILDWFISQLKPEESLVLLLDWTEFLGDHLLMVALPLEKRAVPVFWNLASHQQYHDEFGRNLLEDKFFGQLRKQIPKSIKVTIVADRGFGRTNLFKKLNRLGFGYIIRVKDDTWIRTKSWQGVLAYYPLKYGEIRRLDQVEYRKNKGITLSLITKWDLVKDQHCLWYLATNRPDEAASIVNLYEKRMWIEEMFRDIKGQHFCLNKTRVKKTKGRDRLLAAVTVSILLACFVGMKCLEKQIEMPAISTKKANGLSILSLGLEVLKKLGRSILASAWVPKIIAAN